MTHSCDYKQQGEVTNIKAESKLGIWTSSSKVETNSVKWLTRSKDNWDIWLTRCKDYVVDVPYCTKKFCLKKSGQRFN